MPDIHAIYRYPIKGLSPELLLRAELLPHETIPGDRLYAIENGPSGFNPASPAYLSKTHFLMLMKNERLASLRGAPRVLHADGHSFSDLARKVVSIINLASIAAVEDMVGAPVNPLRFRGNLYGESS